MAIINSVEVEKEKIRRRIQWIDEMVRDIEGWIREAESRDAIRKFRNKKWSLKRERQELVEELRDICNNPRGFLL